MKIRSIFEAGVATTPAPKAPNSNGLITNPEKVKAWLNDPKIARKTGIKITSRGVVNAKLFAVAEFDDRETQGGETGHLLVRTAAGTHIPVQFGQVANYFSLSFTDVTTLIGSPRNVALLSCYDTYLKNCHGAPAVMAAFRGSTNAYMKDFDGLQNSKISELVFYGTSAISDSFQVHTYTGKIGSITGLPPSIEVLTLGAVENISGLHHVCPNVINVQIGPGVKRGLLSLIALSGNSRTGFNMASGIFKADKRFDIMYDIVLKHASTDHDVLACQEELIDNDFDEEATL